MEMQMDCRGIPSRKGVQNFLTGFGFPLRFSFFRYTLSPSLSHVARLLHFFMQICDYNFNVVTETAQYLPQKKCEKICEFGKERTEKMEIL